MATTASNAWMPAGRHELNIGSSLARALKARKSGPVKPTLNRLKPDREFYSFRYNFKPESVDSTKPGSIEIQAREEGHGSSVNVVRPSTQNDHGVGYVGTENPAREFECVLIWDEETGTVTLEKIESNVVLTHDHKRVHVPRHVGSPAPAPAPRITASSSASSSQGSRQPLPRKEEEESEGEIPETKPKSPPRVTTTAQSKPKQAAQTQASQVPPHTTQPVARPAHVLPAKPAVPTKAKAKAKAKASAPASFAPSKIPPKGINKREAPAPTSVAEETLEIRRPVQPPPTKKPKIATEKKVQQLEQPAPQPKPPVSLSFPDSSSLVSFPPPVPAAPAAPEPVATTLLDSEDEEDEEDWVPVPSIAEPQPPATLPPRTIVMEEIEPSAFTPPPRAEELPPPPLSTEDNEIDMDALEAELLGELDDPAAEQDAMAFDEDEDFLLGAVSPVTERQPQSLAQYAGGGDIFDDDEYSSSEDSDDD